MLPCGFIELVPPPSAPGYAPGRATGNELRVVQQIKSLGNKLYPVPFGDRNALQE